MALTPSGAISLADINTALGRSATASISMDDSSLRFIANAITSASTVSMSSLQDKYYFSGSITAGSYSDKFGTITGYLASYGIGSISGTLFGSTITALDDEYGDTYLNLASSVMPNRSTYRIRTNSYTAVPLNWVNGAIAWNIGGGYQLFGNNATAPGQTFTWQFTG